MRRVLVLSILLFFNFCRESTSPTEPGGGLTTASLSGTVIDDATLQPAAGAAVVLRNDSYIPPSVTATTSGNGSYAFTNLKADVYGVAIRLVEGPTIEAGTIRLLSGMNHHDFHLTRNACVAPYGVVRDARTGNPIRGAIVTIWTKSATTDANGEYRIDFGCDPLAGSTITIEVQHASHKTYSTLSRVSFLCTCSFDFVLEPK